MYRLEKPKIRLIRAMYRISRDKWLSPKEVQHISHKLCSCMVAPWSIHSVTKSAFSMFCYGVGMWQGEPPFRRGIGYEYQDRSYSKLLKMIQRKSDKTDIMIFILKEKAKWLT